MIEKILERLEENTLNRESVIFFNSCGIEFISVNKAKEIVHEVAKEYGNGWIPCEVEMPKEHPWGAGHKKSNEVFVTFLDCDGNPKTNTDNTYDGEWNWYGSRVIAWMTKPIPAPYQKGE